MYSATSQEDDNTNEYLPEKTHATDYQIVQ